jgi:serine/threonine protein kinase
MLWQLRKCPQIARIYGYSEAPVGLIMKYYWYGDFDQYIRNHSTLSELIPYTETSVVTILKQVCMGVVSIHEQNYVHCDLKPYNILLDVQQGNCINVALTDFGFARILDHGSMKVQAFIPADLNGLSLSYAAPEVILRVKQRIADTDVAVWKAGDVYSMAIIILRSLKRIDAWALPNRVTK